MEIQEMDKDKLLRHLIVVEREIKTKMSEKKQIKEELNKRFDEGRL